MELIRQQANPPATPTVQFFRELAVLNDVWLSLGGIQELRPDLEFSKISNAHVIISPDGAIKSIYRKVLLSEIYIRTALMTSVTLFRYICSTLHL